MCIKVHKVEYTCKWEGGAERVINSKFGAIRTLRYQPRHCHITCYIYHVTFSWTPDRVPFVHWLTVNILYPPITYCILNISYYVLHIIYYMY